MTIPLLPCPGCGSAPSLRAYRGVRCSNNACWWEVEAYGPNDEAILAAQWNHRTPLPHALALQGAAQSVVHAYKAMHDSASIDAFAATVHALAAVLEEKTP